jgi:S-adenosylmethionine/arginine decarboxylase-like enzyme
VDLHCRGYGDPFRGNNAENIRELIVNLAWCMNMKIINGPTVVSFKDAGQPEAGLSAFAIIAESHIAIHTWPECNGFFRLDIGSCKQFETQIVKDVMEDALRVTEWLRLEVHRERGGPPELGKGNHGND